MNDPHTTPEPDDILSPVSTDTHSDSRASIQKEKAPAAETPESINEKSTPQQDIKKSMDINRKPEDKEDLFTKRKEKKNRTVGQEILSWIGTLLLAVAIALTIRIFLAEPIRVDGRSMLETLQDGEIVLVTKPSVLLGNLNRGDVVICRYPNRNKVNSLRIWGPLDINLVHHEMFVKRLVALPGDSIEIRDRKLYINDQVVQEDYITYFPIRDFSRIVLKDDQYMVIGDNRPNSHDSLSADVGPISRDMIVGKASMVLLPLNKIRFIK